jgi:hypothetical protein
MKTGQKNCPVFLVGITSAASAVFGRFRRDLSAVGKFPEKSQYRKSEM